MTTAYDAATRHAVYVERLKARAVRDVLELLRPLGDEIFTTVAASDLEKMTRREVQSLVARLNRMIRSGYEPVIEEINNTLRQFGFYEGGWTSDMLVKTGLVTDLGVASDADIWAAVNANPFAGRFLRDWYRGLPDGTARRVREAITQGYADGLGAVEVARQIRGTRANPGILATSARGAETMVRTAFNHTATEARNETYKKNPSVLFEQWVSVLDHRTTPICQSRDGNFYPRGEGPRPPAHPACRATMVPVTNRNRARLENRKTYNGWLKAQRAATQDDILGKTKGRLYRKGGLTVDRFVNRSGQEYTLEQLKAKDAEAWAETYGDDTVEEAIQEVRK